MTEYNNKVDLQRRTLAAEEYKNSITDIHTHRIKSMWYETEQTKKHTDRSSVCDTTYMDGRIEREVLNTGEKFILVEGAKGEKLVGMIERHLADMGKNL